MTKYNPFFEEAEIKKLAHKIMIPTASKRSTIYASQIQQYLLASEKYSKEDYRN
jgi:hypothetical protein